jgi:hypothetical protein
MDEIMVKEDNKREKKPVSGNGAQISTRCAICGTILDGKALDHPTFQSMQGKKDSPISDSKILGVACGNCGYTFCWQQHREELKALRISVFRMGPCPDCGEMIRGNNIRFITKKLTKGPCMVCGKEDILYNVTVWSGIYVEGKKISPDIKWMGFVTLIPGDREKGKMVKVESENLKVCHMCFISGESEKFVKDKRLEHEKANYIVQREQFSKVKPEDK